MVLVPLDHESFTGRQAYVGAREVRGDAGEGSIVAHSDPPLRRRLARVTEATILSIIVFCDVPDNLDSHFRIVHVTHK